MLVNNGGTDNEDGPESESDEYAEISPNGRWHRRDQTVQIQGMYGVNSSYLAIDMEEGKEVVWNEIEISKEMHSLIRQDASKEAVERVLKIFKRVQHVNLITYGGYWIDDNAENDTFKIVYITEYTSAGTLRSFLRRSRINKKAINERVWRRWCRQILRALDYLHSSSTSITHGHLNCDTIYIHHDGIIKVGSVAPNIIKDFLQSLKEGEDFDEKACYKTPNSKDIYDFGNLLLEVFGTGVTDPDMGGVAQIHTNTELQQKKKKRPARDMTEDDRKLIFSTAGEDKARFLRRCFSGECTVSQLMNDELFIEVPPLRVMAFYAIKMANLAVNFEQVSNGEDNHHIIVVNNKQRKHETAPLDYEKLTNDIESGMFPLCGINLSRARPKSETKVVASPVEPPTSKAEERLILKIKCNLNPTKSGDENRMNLTLEFQMTDQMIRKLDTEISLEEDTPEKLADELIGYNLLNKGDRQMVIESLEEVLSV